MVTVGALARVDLTWVTNKEFVLVFSDFTSENRIDLLEKSRVGGEMPRAVGRLETDEFVMVLETRNRQAKVISSRVIGWVDSLTLTTI